MKQKISIFADENMPFVEEFLEPIKEQVRLTRFHGRKLGAIDINDADALLVRSITKVNQSLLSQSKVGFVGSATIGTDHIDKSFLASRNIPWYSSPGCNAIGVVNYVQSCLFNLQEQNINWMTKTIAVMGSGNVGSRLAQRLLLLNKNVLQYDPPREKNDEAFTSCSEEQLLNADIICMHLPLTKSGEYKTEKWWQAEKLQKLKDDVVLINAGRGEVIDEAALLKILPEKKITLMFDVFESEPNINKVWLDKCLISTPHIAGYSIEGKCRGTQMVMENLYQWLKKKGYIDQNIECPSIQLPFYEPLDLSDIPSKDQARFCLLAVYDVQEDHLDFDNVSLFDQLRKNYPQRSEFSSIAVENYDPLNQTMLQHLGFMCI